MKITKIITSFFLVLVIACSFLIAEQATVNAAPSTNYTITGNPIEDLISVAKAQKGKRASDFNFKDNWCTYFVCWTAEKAGIANNKIFPTKSINNPMDLSIWYVKNKTGTYYYFYDSYYNRLKDLKIGDLSCMQKEAQKSFTPQKGDLILFNYTGKPDNHTWSHIGIVYDRQGDSLSYVQGNAGNGDYKTNIVKLTSTYYKTNTCIVGYLRPNYNVSVSTFTIAYNANGGTGAPSTQTKIKDRTLILSTVKPTRTGYTFLGWSASKTATSATYLAGGSYTANASATLYAVWRANSYTVKFNANGGTGSMAPQTFTYNKVQILRVNSFKRTGYTFQGWATTSSGSVKYKDKQSASNLASINGATVNLYAVWKQNTSTFTLNGYQCIKVEKNMKVNVGAGYTLRFCNAPTPNNTRIGSIPNNATVYVYGYTINQYANDAGKKIIWAKIRYNNKDGWVNYAYLK